MGLDCSHDAFHGAYSAFNQLRQQVAWAAGGIFPYYDVGEQKVLGRLRELKVDPDDPKCKIGFGTQVGWLPDDKDKENWPGLCLFLDHSDCEGKISPGDCTLVANDLQRLLDGPTREVFEENPGGGHIGGQGGYRKVLEKFILGCRRAAEANEPLDFH